MHRSHWELEVHARDFQERHWQEAARQRRIDEAMGALVNPFNLGVARLVRTAKARWLQGRPASASECANVDDRILAMPETNFGLERKLPPAPLARLAQPYADMKVIARGPEQRVREQPRVSSDC